MNNNQTEQLPDRIPAEIHEGSSYSLLGGEVKTQLTVFLQDVQSRLVIQGRLKEGQILTQDFQQ